MKNLIYILAIISTFSCKKDQCWNGFGNEITTEVALTKSFDSIYVGKGIIVNFTQDYSDFVEVTTGDKILNNISISESGNSLHIENLNKCDFLRSYDKKTVIDIHQKTFDYLYLSTEEDITFTDTIYGERILIYQEFGGGELDAKVNCNYLKIVCYNGSGNFKVSGVANVTEIITKVAAFGDARELKSKSMHITNISKDDLYVNFEGANVTVSIEGTGNVIYRGTPNTLTYLPFLGVGRCIPE